MPDPKHVDHCDTCKSELFFCTKCLAYGFCEQCNKCQCCILLRELNMDRRRGEE